MWRLMIALAACTGTSEPSPDAEAVAQCGTDSANLATPGPTLSLASADLDGDGHPDLIAVVEHGILVALNHDDGTFSQTIALPLQSPTTALAIGDLDGDGILDLVIASDGSIAVAHGHGDGSFTLSTIPVSVTNARSLALADFNKDGVLDIAIGGAAAAQVMLGNGDGSYRATTGLGVPHAVAIAAVDVDRDGDLDLVVGDGGIVCFSNCTPSPGKLVVQRGHGDGTFEPATTLLPDSYPWAITTADFDRDGVPDLLVGTVVSYVLRGTGTGTFAVAEIPLSGYVPVESAVLDFDGDGNLDIVQLANNNAILVDLGHGDGTFAPEQQFQIDATAIVAVDNRLIVATSVGFLRALHPACH